MGYDINAMIQQVAKQGPDQTKVQVGGDYTPPAEGTARARFVGYFELGKHEENFGNEKKVLDKCELVFELSGKNYPPIDHDGVKEPLRMTLELTLSQSDKGWFVKTFSAMNWEGKAKHIVQLLGEGFFVDIKHRKKTINGKEMTFADITRGSVRKPFTFDAEKDEDVRVEIAPAMTPIKAFVAGFSTPEMWDSIKIDGSYPERKDESGKVIKAAKSKNVIQEKIMSALNFKGMPIYEYALGKFSKEDSAALENAINDADSTPQAAANDTPPETVDDAMAGVA